MKALCWTGVNKLAVETVPDPQILNAEDIIVKVNLSTTCGSDLHTALGGYIRRCGPATSSATSSSARWWRWARRSAATRSVTGWWSARSSPAAGAGTASRAVVGVRQREPEARGDRGRVGFAPGGCFGYSHAMGGFAGSHAEYVRVPFADQGAFGIPDGVSDMTRCSPRTRRRRAGRAQIWAACDPVTWSPSGAPVPSGSWPPGRDCSAPSG